MSKLYCIHPYKHIGSEHQPEWDSLLKQISPKWDSWLYYASDNKMILVIDEVFGQLQVHVVHNLVGLWNVVEITDQDTKLLKGLALKKIIQVSNQ